MEYRQTEPMRNAFPLAAILCCMFLLWSCGGGASPSGNTASASGTGALSFNIVYHDGAAGHRQSKEALIDCAGQGVATVDAMVYDAGDTLIAAGGPWQCSAGRGSIASVPSGNGLSVVIRGKTADGAQVFRGRKAGIQVVDGSDTDVGTIDCYAFVPTLLAPADGSMFDPGAMVLQWEAVDGAAEYQVLVSQNSDMSDPVSDQVAPKANHRPTGLSGDRTCYWQVFAVDSEGNWGIGSQIWSFTTPVNISPVANIGIPAKGSTCIVGQAYEFSGSGNDSEDGVLNGASLVWTSDVAGQIGTGDTCAWGPLDETHAGTHKITLTATDSQGATGTDTVVITIATGRLPDTGQEQLEGYEPVPGEDMTYTINPPAYTKLDKAGNDLAEDASDWAMVRDDVTGLIWEIKTDDSTIHDKVKHFTWQGARDDFVTELNREEFGGYTDWRLPTVKELSALVHRGQQSFTINEIYFPNVVDNFYWSATTLASSTDKAWTVYFGNGYTPQHDKSEERSVRAVRGGPWASAGLVDNGDGTVTDTATGLMWQQAETDRRWWEEAVSYCEQLELAGYDDWRLPNINELQSIVDYNKEASEKDPAIDTIFFPDVLGYSSYWSATTRVSHSDWAWVVDSYTGGSHWLIKHESTTSPSYLLWVRAVRGGL